MGGRARNRPGGQWSRAAWSRVAWGLAAALGALLGLWGWVSAAGGMALAGRAGPASELDDAAPAVAAVWPADGAAGVALTATLTITFSEPVALADGAVTLACAASGARPLAASGGPVAYGLAAEGPLRAGEMCAARVAREGVSDLDDDDPPDEPGSDYSWTFQAAPAMPLLNELDAVTPGGTGDFVELYARGAGGTSLDNLVLVFYRGDEETVYLAIGLDGRTLNNDGFFVAGTRAVDGATLLIADDTLRDGPDAIALYAGRERDFPVGAPVRLEGLIDAVVYAPAGADVGNLSQLLAPGGAVLDESAQGDSAGHSLQRYPDGSGLPRSTSTFTAAPATPAGPNQRLFDAAPRVVETRPGNGDTGIALDAAIEVTFSEPVRLRSAPAEIICERSGSHAYAISGGNLAFRLLPYLPLAADETCVVTVSADGVSDLDEDDPPDGMLVSASWSFTTVPAAALDVVINEVDADTPGVDKAEFIELYDGGRGGLALDGLLIVFFNGADDRSYHTVDLGGYATNAEGYFVLGNAAVPNTDLVLPNGLLQNGPDAAALVASRATSFPDGTPVATTTPIAAVVYGRTDRPDAELLRLLDGGQSQIDENGRGEGDAHSNQRCPNGSGGPRTTSGFRQNPPTPGVANNCITDSAPEVTARVPASGATGIAISSDVSITFNEPVSVRDGWATITCTLSGAHDYATSGSGSLWTLAPTLPFAPSESCGVTLKSRLISDLDNDDPPDQPASNITWQFSTIGQVADFVVINELDPNTPSSDAAEFIELYDGGRGHTDLTGLVLVLYNGYTNSTYQAYDLDDHRTDMRGYWLAGNSALAPALAFANGTLQNGPDAVALYAGDAAQFPSGTPLTTRDLIDAAVYGSDTDISPVLLSLLAAGETAADENARGAGDSHSLQRCPNGAGGQRRTAAFLANTPSPGAPSDCVIDSAPRVASVVPAPDAAGVGVNTWLEVSFSEAVTVESGWLTLQCSRSGNPVLSVEGGPQTFRAIPGRTLSLNETCSVQVNASKVHDDDANDPPDGLAEDYAWTFQTVAAPPPTGILINELDADTPGSDTAEFVELYDGGRGNIDLAGLVLVLFNGNDDRSYYAVDLGGVRTNDAGFAVVGNAALPESSLVLPNGMLQNGPDAAALFVGSASDFPNGTALNTRALLDALVYGTSDPPDQGLLPLLESGEGQVDEAGSGAADVYSNQRCPDGAGGARHTGNYRQNRPTPGASNNCVLDDAPVLLAVSPLGGATGVAADASLTVTFSEPVTVERGWFDIGCSASGRHDATTTSGGTTYTLTPEVAFAPGEQCTVALEAAAIHDVDREDPPDALSADYSWSFTTATSPPPEGILINEVDADTPGKDTAEFIELTDGGRGGVDLTGLVVVLWNGRDDRAYRAFDLAGYRTSGTGHFVLGNTALETVDLPFAAATLQNGPDAVSLHAGRAADFPPGAPLTTTGLVDALVYGAGDPPDAELLALLIPGEAPADEAGRGATERDSSQRCPDGAGGPRRTAAYRASAPTPGATNECANDAAPAVVAVTPAPNATGVPPRTTLAVTFSEPVELESGWFTIECARSGRHTAAVAFAGGVYTLSPDAPFQAGEACHVALRAAAVRDVDANDPPDHPAADYEWSFATHGAVAPGILINELDADTPGKDTAEFIELTDGGQGGTDLAGLALVLWNGRDGTAYRVIDLAGYQTGPDGLFVAGGPAVDPAQLALAPNTLQNGPDALALFDATAVSLVAGMPLTTTGLVDAVVYGPADEPAAALLALLEPGEAALDEGAGAGAAVDSLQRCPNGAGGPRRTAPYRPDPPSAGQPNPCPPEDAPPEIVSVHPADGAVGVPLTTTLVITFSETVRLDEHWLALTCGGAAVGATSTLDERRALVTPESVLPASVECLATVTPTAIHDLDAHDPPDTLPAAFTWRFQTGAAPPAIVAAFASNSPVWIGQTVVFSNTSTGPGALSFQWDFGDGQTSTEANPTHRYLAPGAYAVTLTVGSGAAAASATAEVVVRPRTVFAPLVAGGRPPATRAGPTTGVDRPGGHRV